MSTTSIALLLIWEFCLSSYIILLLIRTFSFLISHITPWILIQAYTHKQKENNGWSRVKTTKQSQHYKDYNGIHTQETMTKMKSKNANLLEQISSVLKPEVKSSQ